MFTGIIETVGVITEITPDGGNRIFWIESKLSSAFHIDQSVSHDGVCLTVDKLGSNTHCVVAIEETLAKTTLAHWRTGQKINLERSMILNGRIDGHLVQGHVDTAALCIGSYDTDGSVTFRFRIEKTFRNLIVEKGSICLNGISLTIFDVTDTEFSVAIIPYTFAHTNIANIRVNNQVNLEFDVLGKYVQRMLQRAL